MTLSTSGSENSGTTKLVVTNDKKIKGSYYFVYAIRNRQV